MSQPYLSLVIDTAQKRLATDRLGTLITGDDYSLRHLSNTYVDPVTLSSMLLPAPRSAAWSTNGTGNNARYRLSDYVLTASKWVEDPILFASDWWIKGKDASGNPGEAVKTVASQPRNGGMYLAWYAANASQQDWIQMECGYGADPSNPSTHPISLRIWSSGKVEVYRYGVYQNDVNISGNQTPQQTANTFTDLLIIPFRRREVLLLSNRGGGGTCLFPDIDGSTTDPEIVPSVPFWWYVPSGLAKVQCAPLKYASSGYICGIESYFRLPPATGSTAESLVACDANGGTVTAQLVDPSNVGTSFTPDGIKTVARVRLNLSGDSSHSPTAYAAHMAFPGTVKSTPDAATALDDWTVKLSLSVTDSPSDNRIASELKAPQEIIDAGVANLLTISNRPVEFRLTDGAAYKLAFAGRSEPIRYILAPNDGARRVHLEARDHWKAFEHCLFSDPVPLDGQNIITAFRYLCHVAGFEDSDLDFEELDFDLPSSDAPSKGDWSVEIKVGDTVADWLQRLHDDYMATWFMGWVPTATGFKFRLKSPEGLGSVPALTLYATAGDAIASGVARVNIPRHIYRAYNDEVLEPEANDIWVTGLDLRTRRPIQAHKANLASQDPTTPVHLRAQWLGEIRKYGLFDPTICSQDALERAATILYDRLTPYRFIAEFVSDFLIKEDGTPLWRGDVVTLDGLGDYRIKGFSAEYVKEPKTSDSYWRPTRYTAELLTTPDMPLTTLAGDSLSQIVDAHKLKSVSKVKMQPGAEVLVGAMPLLITRL